MRNPCPLTSFLTLTPSRLFPILLDHSRLYHMTSRSRAYLLYLFSHCRLIIITTIYTCPNPNPSPSLSTRSSYNSTEECEGCTKVFGASKLLQTVCKRFCKDSKALTRDDEEGNEVELGRKIAEGI